MSQSQFNPADATGFYNHVQKNKKPPTDTLLATNKDDWPCAKTAVPKKRRCSSSSSLYEPCIVDFRKQFGLRGLGPRALRKLRSQALPAATLKLRKKFCNPPR